MSDNTGDETNTLFGRSMTRGKRILASALGCAVLVAVIVWGAWLAHKRGAFSAVWEKWQVARQGPAWDSLVASGFVLLALLALVALWKGPQWQVGHLKNLDLKERFDRENEARKTLATILGGIVLLTGGFFTWQNFNLAREGQITDRYSKAIEQLGARDADGKVRLEIRLGGIYALERIANESESDRWPIVEVLCTYVRAHAPWKQENSLGEEQKSWALEPNEEKEVVASSPLSADIQSILTVLGRRNRRYETKDEQLDLHDTDLRGAILRRDFSGANLSGSNLTGANLIGVNLSGANLNRAIIYANLIQADLHGASFFSADLSGAALNGADLRWSDLGKANLSGANLLGARVDGSDFIEAILHATELGGVDLSSAGNLTENQIIEAFGSAGTKLPGYLQMPGDWKNNQ